MGDPSFTASTWPSLARFIAGRPDEKIIAAHWDDVLRLACSVRTGVVSASLMLKRAGNYPRQDRLALALCEVGRIERTLHTLNWLEQLSLRRQTTTAPNQGESRNAPAPAVCFHRLGRLRDRTFDVQQQRASGVVLVTAAISLWNTIYLGRAIGPLRRLGEVIPDALLAPLAPLGCQHINLNDDYLWNVEGTFGPNESGGCVALQPARPRSQHEDRSRFTPPTELVCPFYGVTPSRVCRAEIDESGIAPGTPWKGSKTHGSGRTAASG